MKGGGGWRQNLASSSLAAKNPQWLQVTLNGRCSIALWQKRAGIGWFSAPNKAPSGKAVVWGCACMSIVPKPDKDASVSPNHTVVDQSTALFYGISWVYAISIHLPNTNFLNAGCNSQTELISMSIWSLTSISILITLTYEPSLLVCKIHG